MIVCIDTNVVLGMFASRHPHRAIFDVWFAGRLRWAMTTEILFEYEEIMQLRASPPRAQAMMNILDLVHGRHGNVLHIHPTYRFHQITGDPDDDKFVDCAIAADADYIITSDRDFEALIGSGYKPQPITPEEFIRRHLTLP